MAVLEKLPVLASKALFYFLWMKMLAFTSLFNPPFTALSLRHYLRCLKMSMGVTQSNNRLSLGRKYKQTSQLTQLFNKRMSRLQSSRDASGVCGNNGASNVEVEPLNKLELLSIKRDAFECWKMPGRGETTYDAFHDMGKWPSPTTTRPTSTTRRNRPHPSL